MRSRGFTLIEILAAIMIVSIGAGGAFVLIQRTLSFSSNISLKITASYLAQEGVEIVRNIRDTNFLEIHKGLGGNWDDGLTSCSSGSSGCEVSYQDSGFVEYQDRFLKQNGNFYTYDPAGVDTVFKRKIIIDAVSANQLDINIEVSWLEHGRTGFVITSTQLYNWLNPTL